VLGDLRNFIRAEYGDIVRNLEDLKLDFTPLLGHLKRHKGEVSCIYLRTSDEFAYLRDLLKDTGIPLKELPHQLPEEEIIRILKRGET